jgi:DNA-binding transcriptional LysR family regulator
MDLSTLQLFVEVMRQGSFAAVARDRNLDPSSVSRTIAGLEEELGIRLFQRTTRKLSPTEAGTEYFGRIEPLVEEMQQAINTAQRQTAHHGFCCLWVEVHCAAPAPI